MSNSVIKPLPAIQDDADRGKTNDAKVINYMGNGILRAVYELLLDLAYALFAAAIALTIAQNQRFGDDFVAYSQLPDKQGLVVALMVLGTIILAAFKIHSDYDSIDINPWYRKILQIFEDVLRGVVYILLLVLVTPFVLTHAEVGLMMVAYLLYIVSGAFFLAVKIMKWVFFLCGPGAGHNEPWESQKKIVPEPAKKEQDATKKSVQLPNHSPNDLILNEIIHQM